MKRMVVVMVVLLLASSANADTRSNELDREQTGKLGIASWRFTHLDNGAVRHIVTFAQQWDNELLVHEQNENEGGSIQLRFLVWDRRGETVRLVAPLGVNDDGTLQAPLFRAHRVKGFGRMHFVPEGKVLAHLNAWRPDPSSITIDLAPRVLNQGKAGYNTYRWKVVTDYVDNREGSQECRSHEEQDDGSIVVIDPGGCRNQTFWITHDRRQ